MYGVEKRDSRLTHSGSKPQPSIVHDSLGAFIKVTCGNYSGNLYLAKLDESKKTQSKCVFLNGTWYTPSEVESLAGKRARKWKRSLHHLGKPLSEYTLSCSLNLQSSQTSQCSQGDTLTCSQGVNTLSQDNSACSGTTMQNDISNNVELPASVSTAQSSITNNVNGSSFIVDPVLSFVKALRLKGDADSIRKIVIDRFSSALVNAAKLLLWDSCGVTLESLGLPFHLRRDSDKCSQLCANLDDILLAFDALDSNDSVPLIYCEASELFKLPPISLDPLAEQVERNSQTLNTLVSAVTSLENKLSSSMPSIPTQSVLNSNSDDVSASPSKLSTDNTTYAGRAASFLPSSSASVDVSHLKSVPSRQSSHLDSRETNIILFGLPESKSIIESKKVVDEVLTFLVDKPIILKDLFRLGKYNQASNATVRPRPILIKLSTPWDRKLVLLKKRSLKHFRLSGLFLREDLPPEMRQRRGATVHSQSSAPGSSSYPSGQPNIVETTVDSSKLSPSHHTLSINQSVQQNHAQCSTLPARSRSLSPALTVRQFSHLSCSHPSSLSHYLSSRSSSVDSSSSSSTLVQDTTNLA